jgi:hypothetical protein
VELVETMRSLWREVNIYREDNERMMKCLDEFLKSINMFHR